MIIEKIRQLFLGDRIRMLETEIQRLRCGDFTHEEFQNLCHSWDDEERKCRFEDFRAGCHDYWRKLFGEMGGIEESCIPPHPVYGRERSPRWDAARKAWLKEHPECEVSGATKELEVHHVVPFHERPELELDPGNFMTLARPYHFLVGHFCNWSKVNLDARKEAARWRAMIATA